MSTSSEYSPPDEPRTRTGAPLQAAAQAAPAASRFTDLPSPSGLGEAEAGVFAALLERSSDLIGVASVEDQLLFINRAGRALAGLAPAGELAGQALTDLVAASHRDSYRARSLPALLARGEWAGETWLHGGRAGEMVPVWLQVFMLPAVADQRHGLMAVIGRDISERHGVARTLSSTRDSLVRATQAAQLGERAAAAAHELSQPLAAMVASAQACARWLARDPPELGEARAAVAHIAEIGLRGGELLDRMRLLIRQSAVPDEEVDVNDAIRQALQMARTMAVHTEVALSLKLQPGLPAVRCDAAQLQRVLLNLMKNSSQAMSTVELARRQLEIASRRGRDGSVLVEVTDTGGGMAPSTLARLFDPGHAQAGEAESSGLEASRRMVEAHGGTLWVVRSDPQGTVVAFNLPAARQEPDDGLAGLAAPRVPGRQVEGTA